MAMAQLKPDEARTLHLSRTLRAPREQVFRAWTDPQQLIRWWGPEGFTVPACAIDARPGGAWRTTMRSPEGEDHIVSGVYREVLPPARLVFTWGWETEGPRGHETVVTIELCEAAGGTRLELTHEVFESETSRDQHRQGWSSCLDCLEQALAQGAIP
ncbi:MAG TPA: SRPBCC domain-containing protein [Geminicoccaceae bacterium]|nr:SRPBCC domain-containing protein [Geminicoccaceae bacterium]